MHFLRLELNGNLDHVDGLDDAGGKHTRETADDEGLYGVKEFAGSGLTGDRLICWDAGHRLLCWNTRHFKFT